MKYAAIAVAVLLAAFLAFAVANQVSPLGWGLWGETHTDDGIALGGYDPVSYFDDDAPQPGREDISYRWRGADWRFATAAHRERFVATPAAYAPQFGGFCAFAVSKGFTATPSPSAWHIENDALYVFADERVRDRWVAGIGDGTLHDAHEHWARRTGK